MLLVEQQIQDCQEKWKQANHNVHTSSGLPFVDYLADVEHFFASTQHATHVSENAAKEEIANEMAIRKANGGTLFHPVCNGFMNRDKEMFQNPPLFPKCLAFVEGRQTLHATTNKNAPDNPKKKTRHCDP